MMQFLINIMLILGIPTVVFLVMYCLLKLGLRTPVEPSYPPVEEWYWLGIVRNLGLIGLILSPGFVIGGVMGLAREGTRGPFFFIEQAFYVATIAYPVNLFLCTIFAALLMKQNRRYLALMVQSAPIMLPILLATLSTVLP